MTFLKDKEGCVGGRGGLGGRNKISYDVLSGTNQIINGP